MKSSAIQQPYFSAYPLKSVPSSAGEEVSTLHITSGGKKRRFNNRLFFMPMVDPYREEEVTPPVADANAHTDYIQVHEAEWYSSYE